MTRGLTGAELRDAARRRRLRQKDVARATGLSVRTVNRLFNFPDSLDARPSTVDAIARAVGLECHAVIPATGPLLAIELPLATLARCRSALPGLCSLHDMARDCREHRSIVDRMIAPHGLRMSVASLLDDELYFDRIGDGIRWAADRVEGSRGLDIADPAVARTAAERYWKALFTGAPILQYVRTPLGLEFTALTVATDLAIRPRLVTISALGRPPFAQQPAEADRMDE